MRPESRWSHLPERAFQDRAAFFLAAAAVR
jgi:hypothetical protein